MGSWTLLFSVGAALAGVLAFLGLVADEVAAIEVHLAHRSRFEAEQEARRRAREAEEDD